MLQSPTSRSLVLCRKNGWLADVTERWLPKSHIKKDLFGFIDLVALDGEPGLLGIQATSGSNAAARVHKITRECTAAAERWLRAGNRIQVWGWRKLKAERGALRTQWAADIKVVTLADIERALFT